MGALLIQSNSGQPKWRKKLLLHEQKISLVSSRQSRIQGTKLEAFLVHSHREQCKKCDQYIGHVFAKSNAFVGKGEARQVWEVAEGKLELELTPSLFVHNLQSSAEGTESPTSHDGES